MKKLLFLILIMFCFSCEKQKPEPVYCYTCTRYSYWSWSVILYSHDYCDITTEEMLAKEREENEIFDTYRCIKR